MNNHLNKFENIGDVSVATSSAFGNNVLPSRFCDFSYASTNPPYGYQNPILPLPPQNQPYQFPTTAAATTASFYTTAPTTSSSPPSSSNFNYIGLGGDDDIRVEKNSNGADIFVFDPYNPLNKIITVDDIQNILKNYGITANVNNFSLYKRAFVHRSYIRRPQFENTQNNIIIMNQPEDCIPLFTKSNERLEFVGDGILECITKYYLYRRFPKENEGFMTEKKIALVKNEAIGKMALEMGLHKWFIISKHAELKQTRTNLKKLGCLFEAFIGAIFLDFNKIAVKDENKWFENVFSTGPGFQMVQVFVEKVFEKHVDWIHLIRNDDNYKNILQVKLQKEFKVTPHYMEMNDHNVENGYHMGVYLCLGQSVHSLDNIHHAIRCSQYFQSYTQIHDHVNKYGKIFLFLGEGTHKIKKKAEQIACEEAIRLLETF